MPESRSIFLTGGSGYTGKHVAQRLLNGGWEVHLLKRPASAPPPPGCAGHVHDGSFASLRSIMTEVKPAVVIHMAAAVIRDHGKDDIEPLIDANIRLPVQLLEAMCLTGCTRMINTTTFWLHSTGTSEYSPVDLYAAAKEAFRALLTFYVQAKGFAAIDLMMFDTYGPGDPRPKLLSHLLNALRSGNSLDLTAGEQKINLIHIRDVADAFAIAVDYVSGLHPGQYQQFATPPKDDLTVKELLAKIEGISGRPIAANIGKRAYREREVMQAWFPPNVPGWAPAVTLDEGLAEVIASDGGGVAL